MNSNLENVYKKVKQVLDKNIKNYDLKITENEFADYGDYNIELILKSYNSDEKIKILFNYNEVLSFENVL